MTSPARRESGIRERDRGRIACNEGIRMRQTLRVGTKGAVEKGSDQKKKSVLESK